MKRVSKHNYYLDIAQTVSERSTCLRKRYGAIIVKNDNIISTGYNGFPQGCSDDEFPWNRDEGAGETKYPFVVHAELNAVLNARDKSLVGSKIYVALFPCNECAKAIIQAGIREVVYLSDKYNGTPSTVASRRMLNAAGIKLVQLKPTKAQLVLNFVVEK